MQCVLGAGRRRERIWEVSGAVVIGGGRLGSEPPGFGGWSSGVGGVESGAPEGRGLWRGLGWAWEGV